MPSKFVIRNFTEEGVYHIYNKGLEDKIIFQTNQEFEIFLYYLTIYTQPLEKVLEKHPNLPFRLRYNNISQEVDILAYALLPTHFHLILRQHTQDGIPKLLKQITNAYTAYYNKHNKRSGPLMQGRYKAVLIDVEKELRPLVRYLDREAEEMNVIENYKNYPWTSYKEYSETIDDSICKHRIMRSFLKTQTSYSNYISDTEDYHKSLPSLKNILIESPQINI